MRLFSPKWWPASPELRMKNPCVMLDAVLFILCPSCPLLPPQSPSLLLFVRVSTGSCCDFLLGVAEGEMRGWEEKELLSCLSWLPFAFPPTPSHQRTSWFGSSPQAATSPSSHNSFSPLVLQPCGSNGSGDPRPSLWFPITLPTSL